MTKEYKEKSKCCNAPVTVEGKCTKYYICTKCKQACDLADELKEDVGFILSGVYMNGYMRGQSDDKLEMRIIDIALEEINNRIRKNFISRSEVEKIIKDYKELAKKLHKDSHDDNLNMIMYDAHSRIIACDHLLKQITQTKTN